MALTDNLIAHWQLDETSGTRYDAHGSHDLTDNNTVGYTTGKLSNAASFASANSEHLSGADHADLSMGDVDFTIALWCYVDASSGGHQLIHKGTSWATGRRVEYGLYVSGSSGEVMLRVGNNTDFTDVSASMGTGGWHFLVAWHDAANDQIGVQVDNGTPATASRTGGSWDSSSSLYLGSALGTVNYLNGHLDSVSIWKRMLTSQERSDLYNSGSGLDYPFTTGSSVAMEADLASTLTVTASLGVQRGMEAALASTSSLTASLGVARGIAADLAATSTVTASLGVQRGMEAGLSSGLTLTADLSVEASDTVLEAVAGSTLTLTAALSIELALSAGLSSQLAVQANLTAGAVASPRITRGQAVWLAGRRSRIWENPRHTRAWTGAHRVRTWR